MKSVLFLSLALLTFPSFTTANETPSNEELFEMFKQSQAKIAELEKRALNAEAEAAAAKAALAQV